MADFPMEPEDLAQEIGIDLDLWAGNCHGIAEAVLRKAPCPGMRLIRGHFTGHVSRDSIYRGGPQQHSWLRLEDGRILDPTRWAMDRPKKPYIYCGPNDAYDEAGLQLSALSQAAMMGSLSSIGQIRPEEKLAEYIAQLDSALKHELFEAAEENSPSEVLNLLRGPVEHMPDPERLFKAAEAANLKMWIKIDNWVRVMEPERVTVPFGANRLFDPPPREALTEAQVLFKTFCRFLSIEDREMTFEDELEEYGIGLEEFHDALNEMERWLRFDLELTHLPSDTHNVICLAALDLLGKGYGKELEIERYVDSLGMSRMEFDRALKNFGAKSGLDLAWIYPPIKHDLQIDAATSNQPEI